MHLASYERIEAGDALLVAADGELVRAARTLGHAVAVLEAEPSSSQLACAHREH